MEISWFTFNELWNRTWFVIIKNCIIPEISVKAGIPANPDANPFVQEVAAIQTTGAKFQINNAKLYIPVVTFSRNDDVKFLENIK